MSKLLPLLVLAAGVCAAGARAPSALAIRGARVVTVAGPVLENGTVLLRNGVIEEVGPNVAIPAGAWVVDGKGLTVYPGLIDACSTLGIAEAGAAAAAATSSRTGRTTAPAPAAPPAAAPAQAPVRGPEDRPQTTSWVKAADLISPADRRIESARGLGFTSAVTFPQTGLIAGQGSVINLAGEKAAEMVVTPAVGLYLRTGGGSGMGGFGSFPGALFGVMAYFKQIYLDAAHYKLEKEMYAADPRGKRRPDYDRALEGLLEARLALLPAARAVEIERMLRLAAEMKTPVALYGGHEAYRSAEVLKKAGAPLLVSLKWPERGRDEDPERADPMRTLELREKAPSTPAVLAQAGVKFAFYTDGLTTARELHAAMKRAFEAGLSPADAVRAFTLAPAEIFGVADRLGSVEKGKIANLVVADGELFAERTKVRYVFVDGVKFEPLPEAAPAAGEAAR